MSFFEKSLWGGMLYGLGFMPPFPEPFQAFSFVLRLSAAGFGFAQLVRAQRCCLTLKSSFASGFAFGFGFIGVSLFGIYSSFAVVKQLLFFPPCLAFLGVLWGSLLGGLMVLCRFILPPAPMQLFDSAKDSPTFPFFAFSVSGAWFLFELLRGTIGPFAFPWNLTAHLFCFENVGITQIVTPVVRLFGVYVLSWVFAFAFAIYLGKGTRIFRPFVFVVLGGIGFFGIASIIYDVSRENFSSPIGSLENVSRENNSNNPGGVHLLLIQPNISQKDKLCHDAADEILQKTESLTREALMKTEGRVDIIVWPETAINSIIKEGSFVFERLKKIIPGDDTFLIFGADRLASKQGFSSIVWHNSLFIMSRQGLVGFYDKRFLLPFGEYIPLRQFFPKFFNKVLGGIDCTPGTQEDVFQIGSFCPFITKICSETMFGLSGTSYKQCEKLKEFSRENNLSSVARGEESVSRENNLWPLVREDGNVSRENNLQPLVQGEGSVSRENNLRPRFVLSIANDGWFASPILWQHLAVDRLRAIESRMPLVRVTNTGITAVIASNGVVERCLPNQKEGSLDVVFVP